MAKYQGHYTGAVEDRSSGGAHYMGAWSYFGLSILYCIPLVGFIFLICHACMMSHENRCHYARSYFCILVVMLILVALVAAVFGIALLMGATNITDGFTDAWESLRGSIEDGFEELKTEYEDMTGAFGNTFFRFVC